MKKTSNDNNSAISHHRMVPKVANERYSNIFLIFGIIWVMGKSGSPLGGNEKWQKPSNLPIFLTISTDNNSVMMI